MKKFFTYIICIALIGAGVGVAVLLVTTKPTSKRVAPPVSSPLVIVMPVTLGTAPLTISALGTVKAAQETVLRPRVSGPVEELGKHFEPGGIMEKGALLLQLDAADYKNALALKESALAKAKADYDLEMGQQRVARTELQQLSKTAPNAVRNTSLALREPQLAQAKANLQAAEVDVAQAKLDLERTRIVAPYNSLVTTRNVSLGSQASPSDTLATIVGTDEYHIEAAIPLDKLQSLGMSVFDGAKVRIHLATGNEREGKVLHSIASLDENTRMGRVLVSVMDPLGLKNNKAHLLLGDQVRVELQAGELQNVVTLPRATLRGNDTVWVAMPTKAQEGGAQEQGYTLDIRTVTVAWKDTQHAIIAKGLKAGEHIITSPLGAPIQNMPVRLSTLKKEDNKAAPHTPAREPREGGRS